MSVQQEKFKEIADAIREKTGITEDIKPSEFAGKMDDVYIAGKKAEYDKFWDSYQENGKRGNYSYSFFGLGWNDELFMPKYPIDCRYVCTGIFSSTRITDTKVNMTFAPVNEDNNSASVFSNASKLKTIRKLIIDNTAANVKFLNWFTQCIALESITIEGEIKNSFNIQYSPLNRESITSIVKALSDTVSATLTLNLAAVNKAFETAEGIGDGSTSASWLSLAAAKSNWTISLI